MTLSMAFHHWRTAESGVVRFPDWFVPIPQPQQLLLVTVSWLIVIPLATCWLWRVVFARSVPHAAVLLHERTASSSLLMTDCLYGVGKTPKPGPCPFSVGPPRLALVTTGLDLSQRL